VEASKLKVEAAKTQVLISSGSLVGIAAVVRVLPTGKYLFFLLGAVYFICLSVLGGFVSMNDIARAVTALRHPPREVSWFGPLLLALGLFMFGLYVFYNVPWEQAAGILAWTKARIVLRTITAVVVLSGTVIAAVVFLRRRGASEASEERESPETAEEQHQESVHRRSWWRRIIGR